MAAVRILREHPDFLIVHKPPGVEMHDATHGIVSQVSALTGYTGLHLCHRLDTVTSGVMCLARHPDAAASIGEQFATRQVQKYYLALSAQKPKKKQGTVKGDMRNRRGGQHILLKTVENPAITQFFSSSVAPGLRGFLIKPHTGKTHQIRVALKSLGAAVLGDSLYGGGSADRTYLHAWALAFCHNDEQIQCVSAPQQGQHFLSPEFTTWLADQPPPDNLPWPHVAPLPSAAAGRGHAP
ncbi:TIGR01621 family pseudouridine synthase [Alteromonas sp. ASW11-19]|uniref:TIGR01621 family pseudouridine synthase n=1 Tax=Alteromonas salexigens TaxID=2982530 RepID=A0ABT2VPA3_9ALTE|nr:TIGR01621 family pseudouridine synthase [Alteromonas salexigens]MCU7555109.1 TIGR01621 family pseudouridine synthase [Alteromonas salexigens]